MLVYVENVIIASKINKATKNLLHSLKNGMDADSKKERLVLKKFDFTDDSNITNSLE